MKRAAALSVTRPPKATRVVPLEAGDPASRRSPLLRAVQRKKVRPVPSWRASGAALCPAGSQKGVQRPAPLQLPVRNVRHGA